MPHYRVIGYYEDNGQCYDGDADGEEVEDAIESLVGCMYDEERDSLVIVAVLDDAGNNYHGCDKVLKAADWMAGGCE